MPSVCACTPSPPDSSLRTDLASCPLRESVDLTAFPSSSGITHRCTHNTGFPLCVPSKFFSLGNKQWGHCHRYIMMSLNPASHSQAWRQTQKNTRNRSIWKKNNTSTTYRAELERNSIIYLPRHPPTHTHLSPVLLLDLKTPGYLHH